MKKSFWDPQGGRQAEFWGALDGEEADGMLLGAKVRAAPRGDATWSWGVARRPSGPVVFGRGGLPTPLFGLRVCSWGSVVGTDA